MGGIFPGGDQMIFQGSETVKLKSIVVEDIKKRSLLLQIAAIDIRQGTERPYYIAQKGLRPEGIF